MVTVRIIRNCKGQISQIHGRGHTNYAEHGKDIVCAAVSTLMQTAIMGLDKIAGIPLDLTVNEGSLDCIIKSPINSSQRDKADIILETMLIGLIDIKEQYGQYLDIHDDHYDHFKS